MNTFQKIFRTAAFLGLVIQSPAVVIPIPGGDFEGTATDQWLEVSGDGTFLFNFPTTGGNPDGHAEIDHSADDGGFGIYVSASGGELSLESLGLTAGRTHTFQQDMILKNGANVGGLKIEFLQDGVLQSDTGDLNPEPIEGGLDWQTYTFDIAIPENVNGIKFILLWGSGSSVGFDNISVNDEPLAIIEEIPNADFETAEGVTWNRDSGGGTFVYDFPASGGNPGGFARLDHSADDGGFGVLVSNSGNAIPFEGLGLTPGESYTFKQDIIRFSGENFGGFKIDFFNDGAPTSSTGDLYPETVGDGSEWATYEFLIEIPLGSNGLKIVPLWGPGSVVGFDNITFDPMPVIVAPVAEIPNGDFEAGMESWTEVGAPNSTFSYPESGGNPGRYGVITNDGGGFGVWVANGDQVQSLASLGLNAGRSYPFQLDMLLLSGTNIGGFKVDFFNGNNLVSSTGDQFPDLIGDGSTWETYAFEVAIPTGANGIKVVPLWGAGSSVGFDNIMLDPTPIPAPPILNADFEMGGTNWSEFADGTTFSFPETGGNPGGFAQMTSGISGFGVLVANNNGIIPLTELRITAGEVYDFSMDMKIFEGPEIGGLKVEFYREGQMRGDSGDIYLDIIGNGDTWESYIFDIFIDEEIDGIKLVPLWGVESTVGYDNIQLVNADPEQDFSQWIAGFPEVGTETGFNDDPDGDGQANGLENFLGTDPGASSSGLIAGTAVLAPTRVFTFTHSQNALAVSDLGAPIYEWSSGLSEFLAGGVADENGTTVTFTTQENNPSAGMTTVRAFVTGDAPTGLLFTRVRVQQVQ